MEILVILTSSTIVSLFFVGVIMRFCHPEREQFPNWIVFTTGLLVAGLCMLGICYLISLRNFKQPIEKYTPVTEQLYRIQK